jgi:hypothetical protein
MLRTFPRVPAVPPDCMGSVPAGVVVVPEHLAVLV